MRESTQKSIVGLEDPLVLANYKKTEKKFLAIEDYFVRVLFVAGNHWVCVAGGYNCEYRTSAQKIAIADVALYDSGGTPRRLDPELARQLGHFCNAKSGKISVVVKKTLKQKATLCGFYAAAYATALCNFIDPENIDFTENLLPAHFLECLKSRKVTMFPHKVKNVDLHNNVSPKIFTIDLNKL